MKHIIKFFVYIIIVFLCIPYSSYAGDIARVEGELSKINSFMSNNIIQDEGSASHSSQAITRSELIDMLIDYTNINDVYVAESLYTIASSERRTKSLMYEDYHVSTEKELLIRRLITIGAIPNDYLIYPDKLCTWDEAVTWIMSTIDRSGLVRDIIDYHEYARRIVQKNIEPNETKIFDNVQQLMFYSLFHPLIQRDYSKSDGFYYEPTSDMLYMCHDLKYKAGYVSQIFSDKTGAYIEENRLNSNDLVLYIYKESGEAVSSEIFIEINCDMFNKINYVINFVHGKADNDSIVETHNGGLIGSIDSEGFYSDMQLVNTDEVLRFNKIYLWDENAFEYITRAQVVKTAFQIAGNSFRELPLYDRDLPFKDVSRENCEYYNYISSLYNANVISGYSDGNFCPDKPCTYGEAAKIFCMVKGWGEAACNLASDADEPVFPIYYFKVLEQFDVFELNTPCDEINIKSKFSDLVWHFWCIPFSNGK